MAPPKSDKLATISSKLKDHGIVPRKNKGNCAKAAILRGFIKFQEGSDLDQVVHSGTLDCGHNCSATLRDLLQQLDYAGNDYDEQEEAVVFCDKLKARKSGIAVDDSESDDSDEEYASWCNGTQFGGRTYVTGLCYGKPRFDSGRAHNHCTRCSSFGGCIGDYRQEHCRRCGEHYYAGAGGMFKCRCRGSSSDSESESERLEAIKDYEILVMEREQKLKADREFQEKAIRDLKDKLISFGVEPDENKGNCARAAINNGQIKLDKESDLDQVVYADVLDLCGHTCRATLRDLLKQPDCAEMDFEDEDGLKEAVVFCDNANSEADVCTIGRTYVTGLCSGDPRFTSGKYHLHCTNCEGFGRCIGDAHRWYKVASCRWCGKKFPSSSEG